MQGRYCFGSTEARQTLQVSADASKLALHRLSRQGLVVSPARGFYVIVPPEYRSWGCLPAEQFVPDLMDFKGLTYHAGLLDAAGYYGVANQGSPAFQVFVAKNRRPIQCGKVHVTFIARKHIENVPVREVKTPRGTLSVSTPEATAIELAGYPNNVGGFDEVVRIVAGLAGVLEPQALAIAAATAPITWSQRLGYLLDYVGQQGIAMTLKDFVAQHAREYTMLIPGVEDKEADRSPDWKLIVNARLQRGS